MLVRAGTSHLYIIDLINFKFGEKIEDFWLYEGKQTTPIAAASNLEAENIIGISLIPDSVYLLHYYRCGAAFSDETNVYKISNLLPKRNV